MADHDTKRCRCCQQVLPRSEFFARPSNRDGLYSYCRACNVIKIREYQSRRPDWKEYKRAYDRERVQRLKDEIAEKNRARYLRNRERRLAQAKAYAEANRDKVREIKRSYRHRRRSVERTGMTGREMAEWVSAQKKVCYWCGSRCPTNFHVDHYHPLAKGGKHEASNLVIACRSCNSRKQARDPLDFAREVGRLL